LAGLIDADGHFQCTKKGYASLKIIMYVKDKSALYEIKHKYGGSVKSIARSNALKYKIQDIRGLINLINDVNGFIRNPVRMLQLNKIPSGPSRDLSESPAVKARVDCVKYNIKLKEPKPLTYNDG
jgi:peptidyl-tRNA hydrolase